MECPYSKECAIRIYWPRSKEKFIREVCTTDEHPKCTHYMSLKAQHDERQRLYGNPHYGEPDWDEVASGRG